MTYLSPHVWGNLVTFPSRIINEAKKGKWGKHSQVHFPPPSMLTEVLLKAAPLQDLNLWPLKHEAAPLPSLLEKLLFWWVESNWTELASGQDPRNNTYFFLEVEGDGGRECPSCCNDCLSKKWLWWAESNYLGWGTAETPGLTSLLK